MPTRSLMVGGARFIYSHLARELRRRFDDEVVAVVDDHKGDFWQRTYLTRNAIAAAHTRT